MADALITRGSLRCEAPGLRAGVGRLTGWVCLPSALWIALWFSINTGPWVLQRGPASLVAWLHAVRAFFPHVVLLMALCYVLVSPYRSGLLRLPVSLKLWLFYGMVGLFSCVLSPSPVYAAYWALAYLGAIAGIAAYLKGRDPVERARQANYLSWLTCTAFLLTMTYLAREALFADPHSGYGVLGRQGTLLGMPMSRSTGLARFAAVPGIVGLGYALCRRGAHRVLGGLVFAVSFGAFIYYLQARGSIFGFAGAAVVVMVLTGVRGRLLLLGIGLAAVGALFFHGLAPEIWAHVTRGDTSWAELSRLTGRPDYWRAGYKVFLGSPFIGVGPWGDRMMAAGEVHNTWIAALIYGGLLGATAFVAGLVRAWWDLWRAFRNRAALSPGQRRLLAQTGGLLAFFTLRGIAEQSGSLFNVDLMLMLPAIAYIGLIGRTGGNTLTRSTRGRIA